MQNVTIKYAADYDSQRPDEFFQGVIAINGGSNTFQVQTYTGKATIIHMDNAFVERVEIDPIDDTNLKDQPEEYQAWHKAQEEKALASAKEA